MAESLPSARRRLSPVRNSYRHFFLQRGKPGRRAGRGGSEQLAGEVFSAVASREEDLERQGAEWRAWQLLSQPPSLSD